ncbi:hypothetical protein FHG87_005605 [Trinorchestia longiramus]|nr:hypothetical protein FHG87_005605 [Trinorchestia longiramus]
MAVGKSKKTGSRSMIECRTCKMWVDLESSKGLTEMSQIQAGGNGLLENGREATVNAIMKVVERKRKKNVRVAVVGLLRRPEDGVHLSQEGETKLSQRFICWIRATHLLMEGRMD